MFERRSGRQIVSILLWKQRKTLLLGKSASNAVFKIEPWHMCYVAFSFNRCLSLHYSKKIEFKSLNKVKGYFLMHCEFHMQYKLCYLPNIVILKCITSLCSCSKWHVSLKDIGNSYSIYSHHFQLQYIEEKNCFFSQILKYLRAVCMCQYKSICSRLSTGFQANIP